MFRPPTVFNRFNNPCFLFLRTILGWKVLLTKTIAVSINASSVAVTELLLSLSPAEAAAAVEIIEVAERCWLKSFRSAEFALLGAERKLSSADEGLPKTIALLSCCCCWAPPLAKSLVSLLRLSPPKANFDVVFETIRKIDETLPAAALLPRSTVRGAASIGRKWNSEGAELPNYQKTGKPEIEAKQPKSAPPWHFPCSLFLIVLTRVRSSALCLLNWDIMQLAKESKHKSALKKKKLERSAELGLDGMISYVTDNIASVSEWKWGVVLYSLHFRFPFLQKGS
jgi:hypothetical protein